NNNYYDWNPQYQRNYQSNYGNRDQYNSNVNQNRQERDQSRRSDYNYNYNDRDRRDRQEENNQYSRYSRRDERSPSGYRDFRNRDQSRRNYRGRSSESTGNDHRRHEGRANQQNRNPSQSGDLNVTAANGENRDEACNTKDSSADISQSKVLKKSSAKTERRKSNTHSTGAQTDQTREQNLITAAPELNKTLEENKSTRTSADTENKLPDGKSCSIQEQQTSEHSLTPAAGPSQVRIQVRPLTQLLKQEILAVTQEQGLSLRPVDDNTPAATADSRVCNPSRPLAKNRRRTVSSCNQSSSFSAEYETSINNRIAQLDKQSIKDIINQGDTIFDEHLQFQARKRLRDEIRRQLKTIELVQPNNRTENELVEDALVDAIKLPTHLLQEIEKCFGIDISGQTTEGVNVAGESRKDPSSNADSNVEDRSNVNEILLGAKTDSSKGAATEGSKQQGDCNIRTTNIKTEALNDTTVGTSVGTCKGKTNNNNQAVPPTGANVVTPAKATLEASGLPKKVTAQKSNQSTKATVAKKTLQSNSVSDTPTAVSNEDTSDEDTAQRIIGSSDNSGSQIKEASATIEHNSSYSNTITQSQSKELVDIEMANLETGKSAEQIKQSPKERRSDRESSSSPIIGIPLVNDVIELSSCDELEDGGMNNWDDSSYSDSSNDSSQRRFKLKLRNDAENIVDSFEKLILPNLRSTLTERYNQQHSGSLKSRLHFISCVVTSAEHNSRTFSKIEVAKIQRNLKTADNRLGVEFLLGEIVSVVNFYKQKRREQEENRQGHITISPAVRETQKGSNSSPRHANVPPSPMDVVPDHTSSLAQDLSPDSVSVQQNPSASLGFQNVLPSAVGVMPGQTNVDSVPDHTNLLVLHGSAASPVRQSSLCMEQTPLALGSCQNSQPFHVGLPFLALDSSFPRPSSSGFPPQGAITESRDSVDQMKDIDRRLVENQNRRSFLEEMILKLQKEKSDLEMQSLELQNQKFFLLNNMIGKGNKPTGSTETLPKPPATRKSRAKSAAKSSVAKRTRSTIKKKPPRPAIKRKTVAKKRISQKPTKPKEVKAKVQEEANKQETTQTFQDISNTNNKPPEDTAASVGSANLNPSQDNKPKDVPADQVVIPPLPTQQEPTTPPPPPPPPPTPPPPPEPVSSLSAKMYLNILQPPAPPPDNYPETSFNVIGFNPKDIRSGKLGNVSSPITHISLYEKYALAATEEGDIYKYNLLTHQQELTIFKHSEGIPMMCCSEKHSFLYTISLDGFLKISPFANLQSSTHTVYFQEPLQSMDIAWGIAFVGSRWGHIFTYDLKSNKTTNKPLLSTGQSIIAIKATKEGVRKILVLGCKGNIIPIHDAFTGLLLRHLEIPQGLNVYSILLNDAYVYCGTQKNQIFQIEFVTGTLTKKYICGNGAVTMVSYKERYILVGCYDGYIYVLDKHTGAQVGRFKGAGRMILSLAIVDNKVVTSSKDNALEILEVPAAMVNGQ
ncbi:hypothetical protein KR018_002658, partial [Drosophila ironensis]